MAGSPDKTKQHQTPAPSEEAGPGEITGPALAARKGDLKALRLLYTRVAPELRSMAQDHLSRRGSLKLSPTQISRMAINQFAREADLDLASRVDFFTFAEQATEDIIEALASPGNARPAADTLEGLRLLFRAEARSRDPVVLGLAIREVAGISRDLYRLLRLHYFLDLGRAEAAEWLGVSEAELRAPWREATDLLEGMYSRLEKLPGLESLDSSPSDRDAGGNSLAPRPLPGESDPETSAALIATLRSESSQLRSELGAAAQRIEELEAQLAATAGLAASRTRTDIDALLKPPSLEDVPLFSGSTSDELFRHLKVQYGPWLAHFGAERDSVSLDQIRRHDPEFVSKLSQRISRLRKTERDRHGEMRTPTLGQIMPTEAERGDLELAGRTVEELFNLSNRDVAALVYGRLGRHLYSK